MHSMLLPAADSWVQETNVKYTFQSGYQSYLVYNSTSCMSE